MQVWESSPYSKWYKSHRKFSFTARFCIEQFEDGKPIPQTIFGPFLKSLSCHSKSEEKMFGQNALLADVFKEHETINVLKQYTNEEKYIFCKSLLVHMKEEEDLVFNMLKI